MLVFLLFSREIPLGTCLDDLRGSPTLRFDRSASNYTCLFSGEVSLRNTLADFDFADSIYRKVNNNDLNSFP